MTLIEVVDFARDLLNEPLESSRTFPDDTSNYFRDTTLVKYFNQTQQELSNVIRESFENYFVTSTSISIVNGQTRYPMPADHVKTLRMEWVYPEETNATEIVPISFNEKDYYHGRVFGITSVP